MNEELLRKIRQGDTGEQASEKIYLNDKALLDKIEASIDDITQFKGEVVENLYTGDGFINVVQTSGTSTADVMSQSAVTKEFTSIHQSLNSAVYVSPEVIPDDTHNNPAPMGTSAMYATYAVNDMQGMPLTSYMAMITKLSQDVAHLKARVDALSQLHNNTNQQS